MYMHALFHSEMWQANNRWNTMELYQAVSMPYNGQHIFLRDFVSFVDDRLGLVIAKIQRFYIHVSFITYGFIPISMYDHKITASVSLCICIRLKMVLYMLQCCHCMTFGKFQMLLFISAPNSSG